MGDLTNVEDSLFVCELSTSERLVLGLMKPRVCGEIKWETVSRKQVIITIISK